MIKRFLLIALVCTCSSIGFSQMYMTRNGFVGFYSKTAMEDIQAENNQVYAVIDATKKNIAFTLLMKGFIFRKELMQVHFNENYVESDKYPKANFTGTFSGDLTPGKDAVYKVTVKGSLTIHNVTRIVENQATMEIANGKLTGSADFTIRPEDYNISIPSLVRDKIARDVTIHVKVDCNLMH
jgi:YceI-like domain